MFDIKDWQFAEDNVEDDFSKKKSNDKKNMNCDENGYNDAESMKSDELNINEDFDIQYAK